MVVIDSFLWLLGNKTNLSSKNELYFFLFQTSARFEKSIHDRGRIIPTMLKKLPVFSLFSTQHWKGNTASF